MFVRVKKIAGNRYVYLSEGVSKEGRVRQKTLCYLGPVAKVTSGIPDETREKVERQIGSVDWYKINAAIRNIPVTFEELQDMKRSKLPTALSFRKPGFQNISRGNMPRAEGELLALTRIARRNFDEMFESVGDKKYRMRIR
jgi:hypothetical protein